MMGVIDAAPLNLQIEAAPAPLQQANGLSRHFSERRFTAKIASNGRGHVILGHAVVLELHMRGFEQAEENSIV
jgi:hypothetical protein